MKVRDLKNILAKLPDDMTVLCFDEGYLKGETENDHVEASVMRCKQMRDGSRLTYWDYTKSGCTPWEDGEQYLIIE